MTQHTSSRDGTWGAQRRSCLLVVSGPSGAGKTDTVRELCARRPIRRSVSATTRDARAGEEDGVDYHFLATNEFARRVETGAFAEWANYRSHHYGTLRATLDAASTAGDDIVLEIDVQGGAQVRARYPNALLVFILPPDMATLRRRLVGRGTETPDVRERRLQSAAHEIRCGAMYDYAIVNHENRLDETVDAIEAVIEADQRRITTRQALSLSGYDAGNAPRDTQEHVG